MARILDLHSRYEGSIPSSSTKSNTQVCRPMARMLDSNSSDMGSNPITPAHSQHFQITFYMLSHIKSYHKLQNLQIVLVLY